tara:strand:+ start:716 stop:958 length:243 start_codon:yes stop_codon:yes gene_type:complete
MKGDYQEKSKQDSVEKSKQDSVEKSKPDYGWDLLVALVTLANLSSVVWMVCKVFPHVASLMFLWSLATGTVIRYYTPKDN